MLKISACPVASGFRLPVKAVLLAGGLGTACSEETTTRPAMVELGGRARSCGTS